MSGASMGSGKLAVIILTMNEEVHIERAIHSIRNKADEIFVINVGKYL